MENPEAVPGAARVGGNDGLARKRVLLVSVWIAILILLVVSLFHFEIPRERAALRSMGNMLEQSLAPGEVILVDDRFLGWALKNSDDTLRPSVWTLGKDVSVDSLLPRLERERRGEMVVLATPDGELVRQLDAAHFSVAQEVGWVPWDVTGRGHALMGRGKKRIYFAVAPKRSHAGEAGGKVSSGRK
jgi:hypothetical protein